MIVNHNKFYTMINKINQTKLVYNKSLLDNMNNKYVFIICIYIFMYICIYIISGMLIHGEGDNFAQNVL